jgi:hypothetical protein
MSKFVDRTRGGILRSKRSWWSTVLSDIHFWVPVAVLAGGLLVLRWIS